MKRVNYHVYIKSNPKNVYALNNPVENMGNKKLIELKGDTGSRLTDMRIAGDQIIDCHTDRRNGQKISKDIEEFSNITNQQDPIDIYKTPSSSNKIHVLF